MNFHSQLWCLPACFMLVSCDRQPAEDGGANPSAEASEAAGVYPPRLIRENGAFEMMATIEGVEPNKRFIANLRVIEGQRARIREMRKEFPEGTDFSDETFRESGKGKELADIERTLLKNAEFMAKSYGYVLGQDYLLVPIECDLFEETTREDGEKANVLVKEIRTGAAYERLQDLRNRHTKAKQGNDREEALRTSAALRKEFSFNVEKKYNMDVRKSLLYRKVAD